MLLPGLATATPGLLKVSAWADGSNCVDQAWGANYAYIYQCHGEKNQQWELTSDGQLRSLENQCFEVPETGDALIVATCDLTRRQKWFVSNGQIKPQGFRLWTGEWSMRVGWCVDATQPSGTLVLHGCQGGLNEKFANPSFPTEPEDLILVKGGFAENKNCVDYDFSSDVAYVYACHGGANQRWSFTAKDELRTMGDKCMEYDDTNGVYVRVCNGSAKQKWVVKNDGHIQPKGYQAANGAFVSMDTKCLDASLDNNKIYLYNCIADQANQKFISDVLKPKSMDLLQVQGTWTEGNNCVDYNYDKGYANIYSCHGRSNQQWELTADNQLRSLMNDMCLTLESSAVGVFVSACVASTDMTHSLQQWRTTADGEIHPLGFRQSVLWNNGATRCLTAALDTGVLFLYDCLKLVNQKFRSRVIATIRDHVYVTRSDRGGNFCLNYDGTNVVVRTCAPYRAYVWEFTLDNELRSDGKCLAPSGSTVKLAACDGSVAQKWKPTATGGVASRSASGQCLEWNANSLVVSLVACSATSTAQVFNSNIFQSVSGVVGNLAEKTSALLDAVTTDKFLTKSVLDKAAAVVMEADKALASASATDVASANTYLLQFIFQTAVVTDYSVPTKVLYATAQSKEFLLMTSVLVAAAQSKGKTLEAIKPFVAVFSDQLYEARHEVLWDRVLTENPMYLELSADGTLDDFDQLGGMLVAVCGLVPLDLKMCALGQFFQLIDQFTAFQYRLSVEGASMMRNSTLAIGANVVKLFSSSPLANSDPLWLRVMTLLVFRAPYIGVLSDDVLAHVTAPGSYLPAIVLYSMFGANNANTATLESQIRFLSDQVTTYHFNNLLKMTESRDMDSLDAYMTTQLSALPLVQPINNYTTSDFPIIVKFVAPLVCDDLARAPLSLCQLETFDDGLQSVLRFERQRRNNVVQLDDVLEVDVRKKLDVIDQEKKQYEIMSTLQTVANKIGATIKTEMTTAKQLLADTTLATRKEIEDARTFLNTQILEEGQKIQRALDESTATLYEQNGQVTTAIRQDIEDSSRQLAQRIDENGQAILGAVEESKQELKYQIGSEAEKTRGLIIDKSNELKTHISNEVGGLREFVDVKTNQVIGVVREEGKSTRVFMDQKTNEIIGVVRDESEKTRGVVREASKEIQKHIDVKSAEIVGVVKQEGETTRALVVTKAAELKTHITSEANGVKETVKQAKEEIIKKSTAQYDSLSKQAKATQTQIVKSAKEVSSDIKKSTSLLAEISYASCVTSGTGSLDFGEAKSDYESSTKEIQSQIAAMNPVISALVKDTADLLDDLWASKWYSGIKSIFSTIFSVLTLDLSGAIDGVEEGLGILASGDYLKGTEARVAEAGRLLKTTMESLKGIVGTFEGLQKVDPMSWDTLERVVEGEMKVEDIQAFADEYNTFTSTLRSAELADAIGNLEQIVDVSCDGLADIEASDWPFTAKGGAEAKDKCFQLTTMIAKLSSRLMEALSLIDTMRSFLAQHAADKRACNKAIDAKAWAAGKATSRLLRGRRLADSRVDVPENEPYFTMTYTALTKILLDYQLQEAAFQFCKFYEFRNGGVPPPMCGSASDSARTYYTLSQILQMRSYNPPTYNSVTVRAFLPTKPTFSTTFNRTYPFVDLARLRSGEALYVTLPTWDIDWLKKYSWISPALSADKVPNMYVESIRPYLPVQADSTLGDPTSSNFGSTIRVQSTPAQYLSLTRRDRLYQLPTQTYTFGATYGATSCPASNFVTNPYDSIAGCIQTDSTSDVCLREKGVPASQTEKPLLPSLFSTWRISAEFSSTKRGPMDVLIPKAKVNGTNSSSPTSAGELLIVVDLSIIQITAAKASTSAISSTSESAMAPMDVSTCCAADEFRVAKNKCQKCSAGTTSVLHGYACVPV